MSFLAVGGFFLTKALQFLGRRVINGETFGAPDTGEADPAAVQEQMPASDRRDLVLVGERLGSRRLPLNLENIKAPWAFSAPAPYFFSYAVEYFSQVQLPGYQPRQGLKNLLVAQGLEPQRDVPEAFGSVSQAPGRLKALLPRITPEEL